MVGRIQAPVGLCESTSGRWEAVTVRNEVLAVPVVASRQFNEIVASIAGEVAVEDKSHGTDRQMPPNVKHQRARATASRVNGAISLRALRCMR